jgi:hypothetical protein
MAVERIRQQRTPTQFGVDATGLSAPSIEASSFSTQGVVNRAPAIKFQGLANLAENVGNIAVAGIKYGQEFNEGMQLADLERQHEENINDYINSKKNPQIAQEAAIDAATLDGVSNSLWNKLGEGASIEDIDNVDKHFQDKLSTMKKAMNQGVMSPDEFAQRSLAITRQAINRNPALYDDIINHTKKVLNLSGVESLMKAEQAGQDSAEKQLQKRVDYAMQISKENNIPLRYDRYGNFDLQYAEDQNSIVQKEKFAADVISRQGALRDANEVAQAGDFVNKFGIHGVNGLLNQTHDQLISILNSDASGSHGLDIARQAYQQLKQGVAERANPVMHRPGVKEVVDYANKQADSNLAMLEKFTNKEDRVNYLKNQASLVRDQDYLDTAKLVSPQAMNMLTQILSTANAPRLLATEEGRVVMGKITKTLGNVLSGVQNGLNTDYTVKDPSGKNAVANAVDVLAGSIKKGDTASISGLENIISTVHADSKNGKFATTAEKYKFYDDYIKVLGNNSNRDSFKSLGEVASGKASENLEEYLNLTLKDFKSDVASVSNKGTEVRIGTLPDGRLNIQTSNQADTDFLLQKYGIRINNGLRAFSNLIGSDTKKASELLYPQYDALKGLIPQQEGKQEGGKPNSSNPLNLTVPGKQGVFQQFNNTEDGIRAASNQLDRYFNGQTTGKPLKTLDQIGGLWNNENEKGSTSKANYVKTLVKHTGFDPNTPLDLNNPSVKADLLHAMSIAEGRPIRPSQIMAALGMK